MPASASCPSRSDFRGSPTATAGRWRTRGPCSIPCLPSSISTSRRLAETVGYGPNRVTVQQDFLATPPHRINLLNPKFRRVGVGVVRRGGLVWVTQIFYA